MANLSYFADETAELVTGGWSYTSIRFAKFSSGYTALGQDNKVNNLGLGVLAGFGAAQSLQGNASSIASVLG